MTNKSMNEASFYEVEQYINDPVQYVEQCLGVECWSGMKLVIEKAFEHQRTSFRACHGLSKTKVAAAIAVAFLTLYYPSIVVTSAPTGRQVDLLLWKEIRAIYQNAPRKPPGICQTLQVKINPEWYMIGFATDVAVNLEGFHAPNILWVLDEAKGLAPWLYTNVEGSLTGPNGKVFEISTTDGADQQCPFRQHHSTDRVGWYSVKFSAYDSPFVDPDDYPEERRHMNPLLFEYGRPLHGSEWPAWRVQQIPIADPAWLADRRREWLTKNPYMWQTKVLGEFSDTGGDSIIPLAWVESAIAEHMEPSGDIEYGLDVARMGDDQTVLYKNQGGKMEESAVWTKQNTMVTVGKTLQVTEYVGIIKVDMIGVGAGVYDRLAELGQPTIGVNSAEKAYDSKTYYNLKAEMWFRVREVFERQYNEGGVLDIPDDPELVEDLTGMKYSVRSDNLFICEKKKDFKKRYGRSPNKGDAFVMAVYRFPQTVMDEIEWA